MPLHNETRISILGSGWLGLPLTKDLQQLGYSVKVSTRSPEKKVNIESQGLSSYLYDISSTKNDNSLLEADILIINITSKEISEFETLIANIELSSISKVLFISSTSVYRDSSDCNNPEITELDTHHLKPCPLLTIENLFQANQSFETSIIRFSGLIGYQRHPGKFFSSKNEQGSLSSKTIKNPEGWVNMIHRDDCIGIIKSLLDRQAWGSIYNACASHHPTRRAFYSAALMDLHNLNAVFSDEGSDAFKKISNKKIKTELNYKFKFDDLLDFNSMPF